MIGKSSRQIQQVPVSSELVYEPELPFKLEDNEKSLEIWKLQH
jgi:hypothetical protein